MPKKVLFYLSKYKSLYDEVHINISLYSSISFSDNVKMIDYHCALPIVVQAYLYNTACFTANNVTFRPQESHVIFWLQSIHFFLKFCTSLCHIFAFNCYKQHHSSRYFLIIILIPYLFVLLKAPCPHSSFSFVF